MQKTRTGPSQNLWIAKSIFNLVCASYIKVPLRLNGSWFGIFTIFWVKKLYINLAIIERFRNKPKQINNQSDRFSDLCSEGRPIFQDVFYNYRVIKRIVVLPQVSFHSFFCLVSLSTHGWCCHWQLTVERSYQMPKLYYCWQNDH